MLRFRSVSQKCGVIANTSLRRTTTSQLSTILRSLHQCPNTAIQRNLITNKRSLHQQVKVKFHHESIGQDNGIPSNEKKEIMYSKSITNLRGILSKKNMLPRVKSQELHNELETLLYLLEAEQSPVKVDDFSLIDAVIRFVDSHPFTEEETSSTTSKLKLLLLKQASKYFGNINDVKQRANIFSKYYISLRSSAKYKEDMEFRLDLFRIFLDYILLEDKTKAIDNLQNIENVFIDEEIQDYKLKSSNDYDYFHKTLLTTLLDALEINDIIPSESFILENIRLASTIPENNDLMQRWLVLFFSNGTKTISNSPIENNIEENISQVINHITESNSKKEPKSLLAWFVNLLYFSEECNFIKSTQHTMKEINKILFSDGKLNRELFFSLNHDEMFVYLSADLKLPSESPIILEVLGLPKGSENTDISQLKDLDSTLLLSFLQYQVLKIPQNHEDVADDIMSKVIKFREAMESKENQKNSEVDLPEMYTEEGESPSEASAVFKHHEDLSSEISDIDLYNAVLQSCCVSDRSTSVIESFSQQFGSQFSIERNGKSFSILLNHYLEKEDYVECLDLFDRSLEELVVWGDESNSTYTPVVFKVFSLYYKQPVTDKAIDSVDMRLEYLQKLNSIGFRAEPTVLSDLIETLIESRMVGKAVELFISESIPLKKAQPDKEENEIVDKHDPKGVYKGIFENLMIFATTNKTKKDMDGSMQLYKVLQTYFRMPYDSYLYFIQVFLDNERPDHALYIFADMKEKSREENLPSPSEELYCYLFRRFGRLGYEDGVFRLHLSMKMDVTVDLSINLLNSIMEGYAHLSDPMKVRDAFNLACGLRREIGVNEESCYFMLKVLKSSTLDQATEFFYNIPRLGIPLTSALYTEMIICNCYHEKYLFATDLLLEAHEKGIKVDREMLKASYNFTLIPTVKKRVENIGRRVNREAWLELKNSGELVDETEYYPSLIDSPESLVPPLKLIPPLAPRRGTPSIVDLESMGMHDTMTLSL